MGFTHKEITVWKKGGRAMKHKKDLCIRSFNIFYKLKLKYLTSLKISRRWKSQDWKAGIFGLQAIYYVAHRKSVPFPFLKLIFERQRERERESQTGSVLLVQSLMRGSIARTARSWPEPKSRARCSADWATPKHISLFLDFCKCVLVILLFNFICFLDWWNY